MGFPHKLILKEISNVHWIQFSLSIKAIKQPHAGKPVAEPGIYQGCVTLSSGTHHQTLFPPLQK